MVISSVHTSGKKQIGYSQVDGYMKHIDLSNSYMQRILMNFKVLCPSGNTAAKLQSSRTIDLLDLGVGRQQVNESVSLIIRGGVNSLSTCYNCVLAQPIGYGVLRLACLIALFLQKIIYMNLGLLP